MQCLESSKGFLNCSVHNTQPKKTERSSTDILSLYHIDIHISMHKGSSSSSSSWNKCQIILHKAKLSSFIHRVAELSSHM
jgi:hypothetical protein